MTTQQFPHLYQPIKIGPLTLKNRLVAAPTSQTDLNPDGTLANHNIAYYERKAKGGAAVVAIGDGIPHPSGQDHPNQLMLNTDESIPCLVKAAEKIHSWGAYASMELSHGGVCCDSKYLKGGTAVGPSTMPAHDGHMAKEMSVDLIKEVAESHGQAAARLKTAGFDMCVLHAAHGWLLQQFLSPYFNKRTDEYGGSLENRCRIIVECCQAIRKYAGNFPIELRISGHEGFEGGLVNEDIVEICKYLDPYVDAFHVSGGCIYFSECGEITWPHMYQPHMVLVEDAANIKKVVTKPVITVAGHNEIQEMEEVIASGKADIIAMARAIVADPDLPNKGRTGRADEIRHCLRCGWCQGSRWLLKTARCTINPVMGREYEVQFVAPKAAEPKNVVIIGGGPGGMQAAITAAERGHKVTLFDKADRLGGDLRFAPNVSFKHDMQGYVLSQIATISHLPIKVELNREVTPEEITRLKADAVICGVGATAIVPGIPGIERALQAAKVDAGEAETGETVVVIGGGLVGCETAIHLAREGKKVTIVEMLSDYAIDANNKHKYYTSLEMKRCKIELKLETRCVEITDKGVKCLDKDGSEVFVEADSVVYSVGYRANEEQREAFRFCAPEFKPIGNCNKPGLMERAIRDGYDAAVSLG